MTKISKILFWSPFHGQGQTSNLHATAFIMALLHKKKVMMMQTHFSMNNLESPLIGQNVDRYKSENEIFEDIGLDAAVMYSNMNRLNLNILESCCLTFPGTSILLLPGTKTKNRETFDRDIGKLVFRMIQDADQCVDMVLIDSNSGDDEISFRLMQKADLVVINLTQHRYVLDKFFADYGEQFINNKKAFYLFGDYDDNSCYSINNCRRKYKKFINGSNSGVIPYCTEYMDAQNEGSVVRFMQEGLHVSEESDMKRLTHFMKKVLRSGKYVPEETDYFFHRTRLSVEKMFDLLYLSVRKDRREGGRG